MVRSCANLGVRNAQGIPEITPELQYLLIQDCFAQGSPAAAWMDANREEIEHPNPNAPAAQQPANMLTDLWDKLAAQAAIITPDQLLRYRTLAMAPHESRAAFGQRIIAAWNGVRTQESESHAIELFLDGIKASSHLRFAVHACKPEDRTIVKIVAMAVSVQLQEGISETQLVSKNTKSAIKDLELSDADFRALAKKKGIALAPAVRPGGRTSYSGNQPSTSPGFYCTHHGPNPSHDSSGCFVMNPHLRPFSAQQPQAHMAQQDTSSAQAMLADMLSSLMVNSRPGQVSRKATPQLDAMVGPNPPSYQGQGRPGQYSSPTNQRTPLFCEFCKRSGHTEERCWAKHPELAPPRQTSYYSANQPPQMPPRTGMPNSGRSTHPLGFQPPRPSNPYLTPQQPAPALSRSAQVAQGYYEQDPDEPCHSYVNMAVAPSIPLAKPSPQQGERASSRLKQLNRGGMPVSFGLNPLPAPPATTEPPATPPLHAQFQNLSLNLGKLDALARLSGVTLFEHHLAAPLPQGATTAPLFQALYEGYNHPPATQGISAAVVHQLDPIAALDPLPASPHAESATLPIELPELSMADNADIMAHDAVEADHEGAGQGYTPSLEPDDPFLSAINLGYMQASQGCFPAIPVKKQVNFGLGQESASQLGAAPDSLIAYNSQRATLHYATNLDHAQGITLVLGGPKNPQELLPLTLLDSGANTSIITRQYCQVHNIPYEPCTLRLNTASGAASPVLGKVAVPAQVVFAINTPEEAYTPLTLFVVEGSTPVVF